MIVALFHFPNACVVDSTNEEGYVPGGSLLSTGTSTQQNTYELGKISKSIDRSSATRRPAPSLIVAKKTLSLGPGFK